MLQKRNHNLLFRKVFAENYFSVNSPLTVLIESEVTFYESVDEMDINSTLMETERLNNRLNKRLKVRVSLVWDKKKSHYSIKETFLTNSLF